MSVAEELKALGELLSGARRDKINGRVSAPETLDPTPVEIPLEMQGPPSMRELVQEMVEGAMSKKAADDGYGTFEEEDDFEAEDENLLDLSGYEVTEYPMVEEAPQADAAPPEGDPVEVPSPSPETEPVDPQAST